uniref:TIL domain-containing protein n=1 Tax=Anisakis simplex TaxID=6269 RepID=A0A0M3IYJ7_ANISI
LNEEFQQCGSACPKTCDGSNSTAICNLQCVQGCFCKMGYVLDRTGGVCVRETECK